MLTLKPPGLNFTSNRAFLECMFTLCGTKKGLCFISLTAYWVQPLPPFHCQDTIPKIRNKYSQKRNCAASVPISTFLCLWAIYISHNPPAYSAEGKYVDQSWEYINRSQKHECGNWDWGRAIPFQGILKWDFRCSVPINTYENHRELFWCTVHSILLTHRR